MSRRGRLKHHYENYRGRVKRNLTRTTSRVLTRRRSTGDRNTVEFARTGDGGPRRGKFAGGAHFAGERARVVGVLDGRARDSRDELWNLVQATATSAGDRRCELRNRASHMRRRIVSTGA